MQVSLPQNSGLSKTPNDMSFSHQLHLAVTFLLLVVLTVLMRFSHSHFYCDLSARTKRSWDILGIEITLFKTLPTLYCSVTVRVRAFGSGRKDSDSSNASIGPVCAKPRS